MGGSRTDNVRAAYERLFDNIDMGLPSAADSDECLAELFLRMRNDDDSGADSAVSVRCMHVVMALHAEAHGYHLTHKLLYYMVLDSTNQTGLLPLDMSVGTSILTLCRQIWAETDLIRAVGFPMDMRDLVIEQVFLCGFNGFAEFQQNEWIEHILDWQQPLTGCYAYAAYSSETDPLLWRRKRSVHPLFNNCSDHMSGLAMATMMQFLKFSYE